MKSTLLFLLILIVLVSGLPAASPPAETFHAYADSDICARLMTGLIDDSRIACSQSTAKDGASPVLVRLDNNMVLSVNKQKLIQKIVGQFLEATGQVKVNDGTMKLAEVSPEDISKIPAGPARRLIDPGTNRVDAQVHEKVRHELAMMPYISEFDFISFSMSGSEVILSGWTVRITNRSEAQNRVKNIPGVSNVINNIEVLPMGSTDMQVRAAARAQLQTNLSRYFWGSGSDIKIVVKNGDIILLGTVTNKNDSDLAYIRCQQVRGAFHVFNLLRVAETPKKERG